MGLSHHRVFVMDRGGYRRMFEIKNISALQWGRVRDDKSQAQITIANDAAQRQAKNLNQIDAARHEIVIFRDGIRSWEGPIRLVSYTANQVVINANDICDYLDTRIMHKRWSNAYSKSGKTSVDYVVNRIAGILNSEMANKEALGYNILGNVKTYVTAGDARTSAITSAWAMTVWTHLDNLAAKSGIDYTVVGRALHIWDTDRSPFGTTPPASEKDFLGPLTVTMYGSEMATRTVASDSNGTYGAYGNGSDPYYGEREILVTAYDANTATANQKAPTSAELKSQAQRNMSGRNPTPLVVRIPDNSSIDPRGVLRVELLIPGTRIPLRTSNNIKSVTQMQKLQTMTVNEDANGEVVNVTLYPAASSAVTTDDAGSA